MYRFNILVLQNLYLHIVLNIGYSLQIVYPQDCPEETTGSGIKVVWPQSPAESNVQSEPLCFYNGTLVTRDCINHEWDPNISQLQSCDKAVKYFNSQNCPSGFHKVSKINNKYCYQISTPSVWQYPCFETGGATVITDFSRSEINELIDSLNFSNHKLLWLPAKRQKMFSPVVWHTPGPNWGQTVEVDQQISFRPTLLKNCLVLDVENKILKTETCNVEYESLCFYINDLNYPAKCPAGYHAFRHILDDGRCFGIEKSDRNLTFQEFQRKCKKPMGNGGNLNLRKFLFAKIADDHNMPNSTWCWFSSFTENYNYPISSVIARISFITGIKNETNLNMMSIINNVGTVGLLHSSDTLSCMACEADIIYRETELFFEYDASKNKIYLTVYFPSGLWKYNHNDRGIQCFSDAKGFFKVIDVNETLPFASFKRLKSESSSPDMYIEKTIFEINLVTDRSASYWCEGHTKNFSLITTEKLVVNPQGREVHVFSLVLEMFVCLNEINNVVQINSIGLTDNLNKILQAEKIIIMDILDYNMNVMQVLLHVHVSINNTFSVEALNLLSTYHSLLRKIKLNFPIYNYTFINMSSSVYCLPTLSEDSITLYWDLTPIGHIAAPKQFCLQNNGLPVNRHCFGSYLLGSFWGAVIGQCDKSYEPSVTTTLLFNFVQGNLGNEYVSNFLTTGLQKVLSNTDILIPADVYYLSLSFQQVLNIAYRNESCIETGDISNFAWAIDRIMVVNKNNLRLAQTLNSTNAILDSINDMIAMITRQSLNTNTKSIKSKKYNTYQLAVQPRFIVQISYPEMTNITGLAVINPGNSDTFDKMKIQPLYKNMTLNEVLQIDNLEVATWFPGEVLSSLQKEVNDFKYMHIVINVFSEDVIFQQLTKNSYVVNSRIIEITVPGYSTDSEFGIPLIFRNIKHMPAIESSKCGFWDFQSETGIAGVWSGSGCALIANKNNMSICECYHLTHFGQLININNDRGWEDSVSGPHHKRVLNIITLIGSGLSLTGIIGIWVTAIVFDLWRKKTGTKVLLQLSSAIALPLILIVIFNVDNSLALQVHDMNENSHRVKIICIVLGAVFHYSVLTNFMWMLITAILQFLRYVRVLGVSRPSKFMVKLTLIGWGLPSIPVIIVLIIDKENYIPRIVSQRSICYPSGIYMLLGVVLPVCLILIINIILFLLVIKAISKKSDLRITDRSLVCAQFRVSIFLFFLLGLTWVFGILSFSGSIICSYIFCITSTVQGFVLFIYFVICDPTTRNLWMTVMKPQFLSSRNSVTTISSG